MKIDTTKNSTTNDDLFLEIRTAHRLLAAYYQRLLPTIEDLANAINVNFYCWQPSEFYPLARRTSNPFTEWGWSLLPAICTRYVFHNAVDNRRVRIGELMVEFVVISDSGIVSEDTQNGHKEQPDALNLSTSLTEATSTLKIHLLTPYKNNDIDWYKGIHQECPDTIITEEPSAKKEGEISFYTSGFEIPLSDLMADNAVESIAARIETYKSHLLAAAKEENIKINANTVSEA